MKCLLTFINESTESLKEARGIGKELLVENNTRLKDLSNKFWDKHNMLIRQEEMYWSHQARCNGFDLVIVIPVF